MLKVNYLFNHFFYWLQLRNCQPNGQNKCKKCMFLQTTNVLKLSASLCCKDMFWLKILALVTINMATDVPTSCQNYLFFFAGTNTAVNCLEVSFKIFCGSSLTNVETQPINMQCEHGMTHGVEMSPWCVLHAQI